MQPDIRHARRVILQVGPCCAALPDAAAVARHESANRSRAVPVSVALAIPLAARKHARVAALDPFLEVGDVAEVVASDLEILGAVAHPVVIDVRGADVEVVNG